MYYLNLRKKPGFPVKEIWYPQFSKGKGNQVSIKEPLIDFKLAFKNLRKEKIDDMIVVPILISP